MYVFNAIQITALYVALPFAIQFCHTQNWRTGLVACGGLFIFGSIFMVIGATRTLYDIDATLR